MIPIRREWSAMKRLALLSPALAVPLEEATASGNPVVFQTDVSKPLKSLLIPFTPVQSGTGDPSPQNIRSILPWNGLKVWNGGKNLFNKDDPDVQLNKRVATGGTIISSQYGQAVTGFIPVKEGAKYIINSYIKENYFSCFYSEKDITKPVGAIFGNNEFPKTAPKGAKYLIVTIGNSGIDGFQIEAGQTATAYEPYVPITETDISFPSPVYGGTPDVVSGVLTVKWVMASLKRTVFGAVQEGALDYRQYTDSTLPVAKTNGSNWYIARQEQKSNICVIANPYSETSFGNLIGVVFSMGAFQKKTTFRISDALYQSLTDTDDIEFVYELATPQEITLTPEQITALVGDNTIWSDADGSMTAVYLVSSKYAEEHPVGGLGSGLLGGGLGSGTGEPDEPGEPDDD